MRTLGIVLVAGCKFSTSLAEQGNVDAASDADIDAPPPDAFDPLCYGRGSLYFCLAAPPNMTEDLNNNDTFSTDACMVANSSKVMIGNQQVCVMAANTVSLSAGETTAFFGGLPIVLAAVTSITIDGTIDVSSNPARRGPGANSPLCNSAGIDGTASALGGGGGAGGSFGGVGGAGGFGGNSTITGGTATAPSTKPLVIRGGCKGGTGMPGAGQSALGGDGGGVIFLASQGTITVNGVIIASGAGGGGGQVAKGGGGGGGSGGMIVFDSHGALTFGASARISANGGGGGGGAGQNDAGDRGFEPLGTTPLVPALGGQTTSTGRSQGGNGAGGVAQATAGMNAVNGGGGGGGGFGWIRVLRGAIPTSGTVSPTPVN